MSQRNLDPKKLTGVILAGGRGQRMDGHDKGLILLAGQPLAVRVRNRLGPQVGTLILNANRSAEQYSQFGFQVVSDLVDGYAGPLAGILTGLASAKTEWVVFSACDTPWIPEDLVARLWRAVEQSRDGIAVAHDGGRMQWLSCLVHRDLQPGLAQALADDVRSMKGWMSQLDVAVADFSDQASAFANLNSREDIAQAETRGV
ncbi:molybdenum cofactor guanylyltransferase [Marinobacterium halophilum]|uniref:Molybdenum cofactor guanylyltransferase n=1 Tax=Marinobacterium halophilum TaxID=267374 RepID=A0A2P8ERF5_9GAMM|nr:molybdenum cofactor guanylyltransferase MobA [Marinobacterium halophilum]PSL12062.1 molybdenum cofactor guanylyltransferase [Marinobacterium halophilum]